MRHKFLWGVVNRVKQLILLLVVIFICFEVLARLYPGPWKTNVRYRFDPEVGLWKARGPRTIAFEGREIYINSWGMTEKEVTIEKKPGIRRVAVLGDSFMEGMSPGLDFDQRMSGVLQNLLGPDYEVMNFGVSSVGTVQELEIYKHKARRFRPDLVILAFYPGNDVSDNSRTLGLATGYGFLREAPYYTVSKDGQMEFHPARQEEGGAYKEWLKDYLGLFSSVRMVNWLKDRIKGPDRVAPQVGSAAPAGQANPTLLFGRPWPKSLLEYGVYGPPLDKAWEEAWKITEYTVLQLYQETTKDHVRLLVLLLTSNLQILPDAGDMIYRTYGVRPPADFEVRYPNRRLAAFLKNHNIAYIDMLPIFLSYCDEHKMTEPYFCVRDGHWNALAHRLAAEEVARNLVPGEFQGK